MQTSILIPLGGKPSSMAALRRARGIAQCEHSRLYLLHVVEPKMVKDILKADAEAQAHGLDDEDYARAEAFLEGCWQRLNEPMAAVNFLIKGGKVLDTIAEEACRLKVDAVILGTSKKDSEREGFLDKVKKTLPCKFTVVDEEENTVLEHSPSRSSCWL